MSDLIDRLTNALSGPPPAASSDYDLAPDLKAGLPETRRLRDAAVLVPIRLGAKPSVVLTRRSSALEHHPGQVAFPGGKLEAGESHAEAALREAEEEIGLQGSSARLLGELPQHETVTGFQVRPILATVPGTFEPDPEPGEVEEAFDVPLSHILDPANLLVRSRAWKGTHRSYYVIPYGPFYIWGATARMIRSMQLLIDPGQP